MSQFQDITQKKSVKEQISAAIGTHGMWKTRIRDAARTGHSEWTPEMVASAHNCDFGKWLDSFPEAAKHGAYRKIFSLHAEFHKEAARVLSLALSGKKEEAETAMVLRSNYENLTSSLTKAMMEWKDSL